MPALLTDLGVMPESLPLLMDWAYEGAETGQLVLSLGIADIPDGAKLSIARGNYWTRSLVTAVMR